MNVRIKTISIGVVTITLISFVVLIFLRIQIDKNMSEVNRLTVENQNEMNRNLQAEKLISFINKTEDSRNSLTNFIVQDANVVQVIEEIEKIGTRTKTEIIISSLTAEDSTNLAPRSINKIKARVDIKGEWSNAVAALTLLESLPYKSSISNISLRTDKDSDAGKKQWSFSLQIEILKIK